LNFDAKKTDLVLDQTTQRKKLKTQKS